MNNRSHNVTDSVETLKMAHTKNKSLKTKYVAATYMQNLHSLTEEGFHSEMNVIYISLRVCLGIYVCLFCKCVHPLC